VRLEASEEKTADGLRLTVAGAVWGRTLACAGVRIRGPCAACLGSASQLPNVPPLRLLSVAPHVPLAHQQYRPQLPCAKAAEALAAAASVAEVVPDAVDCSEHILWVREGVIHARNE